MSLEGFEVRVQPDRLRERRLGERSNAGSIDRLSLYSFHALQASSARPYRPAAWDRGAESRAGGLIGTRQAPLTARTASRGVRINRPGRRPQVLSAIAAAAARRRPSARRGARAYREAPCPVPDRTASGPGDGAESCAFSAAGPCSRSTSSGSLPPLSSAKRNVRPGRISGSARSIARPAARRPAPSASSTAPARRHAPQRVHLLLGQRRAERATAGTPAR